MKITGISQAAKNPNRVNVSVDGKFRFSLDIFQVGELDVKVGAELSETELAEIETESQFGKLYARALEYCLMRPHSKREVKDYLWRKTRPRKILQHKTANKSARGSHPIAAPGAKGEVAESRVTVEAGSRRIKEVPGVSVAIADRVFERLIEKGYLDDEKFARWWVETRHQTKGVSLRKLTSELSAKGVERHVIEQVVSESTRNDSDELQKVILKKRGKYDDEQKLIAYLARQGFLYDDIKQALNYLNDR